MTPLLLALLALATPAAGKLVTFDNTKPRLDSNGAILRAHDGTTQRFGGKGPYFCVPFPPSACSCHPPPATPLTLR
jgi:hypothetical protein